MYREISVYFFSAVYFEERTVDSTYGKALTFRLGGEYRECSLVEFTRRKGLYSEEETRSPYFFFRGCSRDFTTRTIDVEFWTPSSLPPRAHTNNG